MADERPLFDKPMAELREVFVRNRFGQADVFGLAGVETWLQWERAQERPNEVSWKPFLARDFTEMCAATMPLLHLQDRATRYTPFQRGTERSTAPFGRILPLFKDGFYWGYRDVGVYIHEPMKEMFVLSETHGKLTIERIGDANIYVGARAVVDVLFAEWDRQRPKWHNAREFLCDALAEEVKRERVKAEADCDSAVAVSADGTKIVHADWVVVTGLGTITSGHPRYGQTVEERFRVFPGAVFRDRKILRTEEYVRIDPYVPNDSFPLGKDFSTLPVESQIARVLRRAEHPSLLDCVRSEERQMFVRLSVLFGLENVESTRWKIDLRTTIFITVVRLCHSPLPDGGVEVTA